MNDIIIMSFIDGVREQALPVDTTTSVPTSTTVVDTFYSLGHPFFFRCLTSAPAYRFASDRKKNKKVVVPIICEVVNT